MAFATSSSRQVTRRSTCCNCTPVQIRPLLHQRLRPCTGQREVTQPFSLTQASLSNAQASWTLNRSTLVDPKRYQRMYRLHISEGFECSSMHGGCQPKGTSGACTFTRVDWGLEPYVTGLLALARRVHFGAEACTMSRVEGHNELYWSWATVCKGSVIAKNCISTLHGMFDRSQ